MCRKIAIYYDEGASEVGVASLQQGILHHLGVEPLLLNAHQIMAGQLAECVALFVPGGADLPYCNKLNGRGNRQIRQFVERGGLYVGICAGAYYACKEIAFIGEDYRVSGKRELGFFDGIAEGSLPQWTHNRYFDETVYSKAPVALAFISGERQPFYYHGGPTFKANQTARYQVIATYPDGLPAIISGRVGQGSYLLSGVHFELQAVSYRQYVVNVAPPPEQPQEEALCRLFDDRYGKLIWQRLQQRLHGNLAGT